MVKAQSKMVAVGITAGYQASFSLQGSSEGVSNSDLTGRRTGAGSRGNLSAACEGVLLKVLPLVKQPLAAAPQSPEQFLPEYPNKHQE